MPEKRVFGYDLVRAVAILMVMLGHVLGFIYSATYSFFISFLLGFFGVELFFVLSGVLIGKLLIEVFSKTNFRTHLRNFVLRRWFRTLPMYYLMLAVYWLGNQYVDPVKNADVAAWKYLFFLQNFFNVQPTFYGISWSLSIEEWFYVLFPFSLFILRKAFPNLSVQHLFLFAITVFAVYFLVVRIAVYPSYHYHFYEGARKIAYLRLDAIVFGIFAAYLMHFYRKFISKKRYLLFIAGLLLLSLNQYLIFKDYYSNLHYFNTVYYTVLGVGLMLMFPLFKEFNLNNSFLKKGITFISKISYSLYLVHWLVFRLLQLDVFLPIHASLKFVLFFIISIALSTITYRFVEQPVLKLRDNFVRR